MNIEFTLLDMFYESLENIYVRIYIKQYTRMNKFRTIQAII
jgi:hypothetical protein